MFPLDFSHISHIFLPFVLPLVTCHSFHLVSNFLNILYYQDFDIVHFLSDTSVSSMRYIISKLNIECCLSPWKAFKKKKERKNPFWLRAYVAASKLLSTIKLNFQKTFLSYSLKIIKTLLMKWVIFASPTYT